MFNLIPLILVVIGGQIALGLGDESGLKRKFVGVLLIAVGVPFLYLDWVYIRRPVERDE